MSPLDAFSDILGPDHVLRAEHDVAPYAVDWRGAYKGAPVAVLRPGDTAQAAAAMRRCAELGLAVVPAGGRTGLAGGATPLAQGPAAVVVSLERMNRIRRVDAPGMALVAEAGCTVQAVQQAAAQAGRLFPLSFGAQGSAAIGGAIGTNAGGIRTIRYGNTRELVLGLEVVLPDGRVLDDLRQVRKDNSGYALRHLFIGAEGTLGLVTAASLRLYPALAKRETALCAVESPEHALRLLDRCQGSGADLVAFELIQRVCLEVTLRHGTNVRQPMALDAPWFVLVEAASPHPDAPVMAALERALEGALDAGEILDVVVCESEAQRENLWTIRETFPECSRHDSPGIPTDTCVPVSAVPEFLRRAEAIIAEGWPEGRMVAIGHMGDGNIHLSLHGPRGTALLDWWKRGAGFDEAIAGLAVSLGGSFSAEHGIGQSRLPMMRGLKDPVALDVMRAVKAALDPQGRMNPGKVLPAA